jgi:hypothetical protein
MNGYRAKEISNELKVSAAVAKQPVELFEYKMSMTVQRVSDSGVNSS